MNVSIGRILIPRTPRCPAGRSLSCVGRGRGGSSGLSSCCSAWGLSGTGKRIMHRRPPAEVLPGRGAQTAAQPVGAETIGTGDIRIILNELGTVTPLANVTVKTQINGQLTEVGFQEGQSVKVGDFLAQIDPRPYQVALEQAQGTLAHDQALLEQAQNNLKRYQTLARQDSIAQQQADDQKFLVAQTKVGEDRSGSGRQRQAEFGLLPYRGASRGPSGIAPGRCRQLRADQRPQRPRGDYAGTADIGDLLGDRGQPARRHEATARRGKAAGGGLRPIQRHAAGDGNAVQRGQPDQHHHRHREHARRFSQYG